MQLLNRVESLSYQVVLLDSSLTSLAMEMILSPFKKTDTYGNIVFFPQRQLRCLEGYEFPNLLELANSVVAERVLKLLANVEFIMPHVPTCAIMITKIALKVI